MCDSHPEGPLQRIGIYNDTVLHMASRFNRTQLARELLKTLLKDCNHQLVGKENNAGSNMLQEVAAAAGDTMKDVAEEMLRRDRELLFARNKLV